MISSDSTTMLAWTRLLRAHTRALDLVETSLKAADMPPLAWYDVLLELERAADQEKNQTENGGMRPFELQNALLLPQYGMSRLLGRIEKAGYLSRVTCNEDGRGQLLFITPAGRSIRKQMWSVYGPAVRRAIEGKISAPDIAALCDLLGKLAK